MILNSLNRYSSLIISIFCSLVLVLSWIVPPTLNLWQQIDLAIFRFLNANLLQNPMSTIFWAFLNADVCDRLMEIIVFGTTLMILKKKSSQGDRSVYVDFLIYYAALSISAIFFKRVIHLGFDLHRLSPTLILSDTYRLQGVLNLKIKDASRNSFPADHALFVLLWFQYAWHRFSRNQIYLVFAITLFFCMPRLVSGGHWFTDLFFGALLPSWVFATATLKTNLLTPLSLKISRRIKRKKNSIEVL
jgi:membrane-associated phospholipid phosphatase